MPKKSIRGSMIYFFLRLESPGLIIVKLTPAIANRIPANFINDMESLEEIISEKTIGKTTDILLAMLVTEIPAAWDDLAMRKNIIINMMPIRIETGNQSNCRIDFGVNSIGFNRNPRMAAKK